jgi:hypothetical protein
VLAELIRLTTSDGLQHFGAIYHARDHTRRAEEPLGVVLVHGYTVRTVRGADHVYAAKEKELGRAVVRWLNGLDATSWER